MLSACLCSKPAIPVVSTTPPSKMTTLDFYFSTGVEEHDDSSLCCSNSDRFLVINMSLSSAYAKRFETIMADQNEDEKESASSVGMVLLLNVGEGG